LRRLKLPRGIPGYPSAVAPAFIPFPLLHSGSAGGEWDQLIVVVLVVLFFLALGTFGYYSGRAKKKRRENDRRRSRRQA
jgi:hypothetical protein